ncbi:MAG: hypothetical protein U5J98_12250 [Halobacteriales archaeon]|nr:hypothetical protein [Halobacteriales archaeon]
MPTAAEFWAATLAAAAVSASLPFYLYGAWVVLREDVVTWRILVRHLSFIGVGLALTTLPILGWMLPRLLDQLDGFTGVHAFLGFQAYAMLAFALTGIARIFQVKRRHDLYHEPDPDVELSALHEDMDKWRVRLRVGVFGYLGFWLLAWVVGLARYWVFYGPR